MQYHTNIAINIAKIANKKFRILNENQLEILRRDSETGLTSKEERFCYEYVLHLNGAKAATLAGYAKNSARITASKLLTKSNIKERIQHMKDNLAETAQISALKIIQEHSKIDRDITIAGLMEHIKAPDFPTAGIIYGYKDVREAFETGKGRVVISVDRKSVV